MAPDSQKSLPFKKPKKKCKPPRDGRNFKGNGLAIFWNLSFSLDSIENSPSSDTFFRA